MIEGEAAHRPNDVCGRGILARVALSEPSQYQACTQVSVWHPSPMLHRHMGQGRLAEDADRL